MTPELVVAAADTLGESPLWMPDVRTLCWIDAFGPRLHRYDPATGRHDIVALPFGLPVGMIARTTQAGELVVAHPGGVCRLSTDTLTVTPLHHPERGRDAVAYNDGKVDRSGRLWCATLDRDEVEPRGCLWRLDATEAVLADAGFAVANGPAFSPDGDILYLSDSIARRVIAYTVHDHPPFLRNRRVFASFDERDGMPDGLTVDESGALWVAMWGASAVLRFMPDGRQQDRIVLPASQPTSVAFGGERFDILYVTSARVGLDEEALRREPAAGGLFAVRTGATGLPERPAAIG